MLVFATSDKGGTGRSVTSANVAYRRALQGTHVAYLDFDFGSPTVGTIFSIESALRGIASGGLHSYLTGEVDWPKQMDVWAESDRNSLRSRPDGAGELALFPGDIGGGEFASNAGHCPALRPAVPPAGGGVRGQPHRSQCRPLIRDRDRPGRDRVGLNCAGMTARWLVFHRWTRQHIIAADGLVKGADGIIEQGVKLRHDRTRLSNAIRFVRTAYVDPDSDELAGLKAEQVAWLRSTNEQLQSLAGEHEDRADDPDRVGTAGPRSPVARTAHHRLGHHDTPDRQPVHSGRVRAHRQAARRRRRLGPAVTGALFQEVAATPTVAALPLSHLSLELGHLYMEDFEAGPAHVRRLIQQVGPWARTAREAVSAGLAPKRARVSTCFLVDDYFTRVASPADVLAVVLEAAHAAGQTVDYLARESACAVTDQHVAVADLVLSRLVDDPPPGTTGGGRPATRRTGWLCNGLRSPGVGEVGQAFRSPTAWAPPSENAANRHSVFVDVQLWSGEGEERSWSCAFLAAVWQLLRLGLLRDRGDPVVQVVAMPDPAPDTWAEMPSVVRLNPQATPFAAYRTYSVLPRRFLGIEHAVHTILSQTSVEPDVLEQMRVRAADESLALPPEIVDRIEYTFSQPWA